MAGCALIGGETAEHPGLLGPDDYDVAGAAHRDGRAPTRCSGRTGSGRTTSLIAMASSGLHSNGYSLARHVLLNVARIPLDSDADLGRPLGEVLLTPTRIYAKDCLALAATGRRPRLLPRHRRRADRQPAAGAAGRPRAGHRPRDLDAGADLRADRRAAARSRRRRWSGRSTSASAWSPSSRPDAAAANAWHCWKSEASTPGSSASSARPNGDLSGLRHKPPRSRPDKSAGSSYSSSSSP